MTTEQNILSLTEENYLKAIYHLSESGNGNVSTNSIADSMNTSAASVTDMIKKLSGKKLLDYQRYQGVSITDSGKKEALRLIRKHRLWESFLVNKLRFHWDEVHEVAEQLEHIKSRLLIARLDEFLGFPKLDPHGDPIPDENGRLPKIRLIPLTEVPIGDKGVISAVRDSNGAFLRYLDKLGAGIGTSVEVLDRVDYDGSLEILVDGEKKVFVSKEVASNLMMV